MQTLRAAAVLGMFVAIGVFGCRSRLDRSHESAVSSSQPSAVAPAASSVAPVASALTPTKPVPRTTFRPVGRPHAVEPGMGLGPIMFGATVPTIERHMGMKCEVLSDKWCRFITAGVEFELTKGAVSGIQIHRFDRPVEGDETALWGVFAGGVPPDVVMAMVPEAVIESIGKPKKTVEIKTPNPYNTVRRDTYDGMILDYDLNPANKRLMLGGIRIVKKG